MIRTSSVLFGGILLALVLSTHPLSAQADDTELDRLRKEIEALRKGQADLQKRLAQIESLLRNAQRRAADQLPKVPVSVEGHPFQGDARAKLTLIEFSDYQ